jgi:hypothetical protein
LTRSTCPKPPISETWRSGPWVGLRRQDLAWSREPGPGAAVRGCSSLSFLHHNALRDVFRSSQNAQSRTRGELAMVYHAFVMQNHLRRLVQTVFSQCIYPYPNFYPQYPLTPPRPGLTFSESLLCTALDHAYGTITSLPLCAAFQAPRPARSSCPPPPPRPGRPPSPPAPPSPRQRRTRPRPPSLRQRWPRPAAAMSVPRSATTASTSTTTAGAESVKRARRIASARTRPPHPLRPTPPRSRARSF